DLVDFNFFDSPVNTQAGVFMYHVVSHRQLRETADLLSAVSSFFLFLLFLAPENIRLLIHHKFHQRIAQTPVSMAIAYHDLTGADLPVFLLAVIAAQSFSQKILRQPFCPCPRTGKKENLKPSLFPGLEILYQQIKASVIGTDRLYLHLVTFP